jgi:hypothetical protein
VRLWRTAGRFDSTRASVATYLFVIARSVAADIRKRPSSRPLSTPLDDVELADHSGTECLSTDTEEQIAQRLAIRDAIKSLPASQQELIALAYYEDLTQASRDRSQTIDFAPCCECTSIARGRHYRTLYQIKACPAATYSVRGVRSKVRRTRQSRLRRIRRDDFSPVEVELRGLPCS